VLAVKFFRPPGKAFDLGLAVKIALTDVGPVVGQAVFVGYHNDPALEAAFPQGLRRHVPGRARPQDDKGPLVRTRIVSGHGRNPPVADALRHGDVDLFARNPHLEARHRVQGGRLLDVAADDVELGLVPGTEDPRARQAAFSQIAAVMGANAADGMELPLDPGQQDLGLADRDLLHLAVFQIVHFGNFGFAGHNRPLPFRSLTSMCL
jgi:hypothetical protein